ncbi:hypothetical protein KC614_02675 [candidate division WWE3 bacterium]|uniref:Fibronectin type-III domain-containing protein n=1 Tax=candidate division WWE3 bacterium TaxID=2053526 RepID=A0A955LKW7_UNCKA|nr:hypothetical protein [candidate division WWE3 bacterium]
MPNLTVKKLKTIVSLTFFLAFCAFVMSFRVSAQVENNDIRIYSVFVNRGVNSATITWKTDPKVKSQLEYADTSGVWQHTPWSTDYLEDHSITLLNLISDENYLYRITAEDTNGAIKTKNDSFTTLSESVVGESPSASGDTKAGFSALLSPIPSPTPTLFPNVLGYQQNLQYIPVMPYYPLAYAGQAPTQTPDPTTTPTTPTTPTPTTVPSALGGFVTDNTLMLVVGLVLGVGVAYLLHQLATGNTTPQTKRSNSKTSPKFFENTERPENTSEPQLTTYEFNVNSHKSH